MIFSSSSSDHDSRLEDWFTEQYRKLILEGRPADRPDNCPDDQFLKAIAGTTGKPSLRDPRVSHVGHCPHCLARVLEFRNAVSAPLPNCGKGWFRILVAVTACSLALVAFLTVRISTRRQAVSGEPISRLLDLSSSGTLRGEPQPLEAFRPPASLDRVTIVLPRLSEIGPYTVAVNEDTSSQRPVAQGNAVAIEKGAQQTVEVLLDLRRVRPGSYYLSTTFDTDEASNYYPLVIGR